MHIESISIRNFQCFGNEAVKVNINPGIMGFVGDNGAGKSAILEALKRLFSPIASERLIRKADVHFGCGEGSQGCDQREIVIDVVFGFPLPDKTPQVFNDIFFSEKDRSLKARIVLECLYKRSESFEDDIDVKIYTIRTLDDVRFGADDERKTPLRGRATQFAELVYIPAHRALGVTQQALKNVLKRIERSANWNQTTRDESQNFAKALEASLNAEKAVSLVQNDLKSFWGALHDGHYDADPIVSVVATEFEQLIRELTLRFEKSPGGGRRQLEELSEGQVSLLYFALSATLHSLIWKMQSNAPSALDGFKLLDFLPPPLTIFALEEPENHLSPFYLPRLISLLEKLNNEGGAQSFVTSHSTSILTRISPRNVRYVRNCRQALVSDIREIPLPNLGSDEDKFITQAILANPELYFARLIIIGEGDSERIVIPRIAESLDLSLDPSFVAFVPIGGRHAQHLWKLASGLKIPFLTLLDFDLGRHGGGIGRIRNAVKWLAEAGLPLNPSVTIPSSDEINSNSIDELMKLLRQHGVYYSTYLDLDMMMLKAFPAAYKPTTAFNSDKDDVDKISVSVFGKSGLGHEELKRISQPFTDEELHAYKSLFESRAKPASHYNALGQLNEQDIKEHCPEVLRALIEHARKLLAPPVVNQGGDQTNAIC